MFESLLNPFKNTESKSSPEGETSFSPEMKERIERVGTSMRESFAKIQAFLAGGGKLIPSAPLAVRLGITLPVLAFFVSLSEDASAQKLSASNGLPGNTITQTDQSTQNQKRHQRQAIEETTVILLDQGLQIAGQVTKDPKVKNILWTTQGALRVIDNIDDAIYQTNNRTKGTQ